MDIIHTYHKTLLKKWILAFTLIISFFVLSGYVNSCIPNGKSVAEITALANKIAALKGGISYKRVALSFYKPKPLYRVVIRLFNLNNGVYLNLLTSRYFYLKRLFTSFKSNIIYFSQQPYSSCQSYLLLSSDNIC
ncbi:MAG: hypothetical protein AAGC65_19815 [Mucilaginibacter sp.]|uniref:hypothetical protein n=1 Tax=Mucilaginibacter sp. TaxID=1882438 RepID=UPI00319EEE75